MLKQERLMIIGASNLQLPAILKAKEMGLYVGVVDYNPHAIGVSYADEFFNVSTVDESGVLEAARKFKPKGIMTLATDLPMRSVAYACEQLQLPCISYETALRTTDKEKMIKAFQEFQVSHPWFYILDKETNVTEIQDKVEYPCISKPVDSSGSRGVVLINNKDEFDNAVKYSSSYSKSSKVIVEEYLKGYEVSVEILVLESQPIILAVTDKITSGPPHFVEMGHSQPSQLDVHSLESIKNLAINSVRALGISCGPVHAEIMFTENGPKMIEVGARMGGDCITTHLVPLSTGIDMLKVTINIALGQSVEINRTISKGASIRYIKSSVGKITSIKGLDDVKCFDGLKEIYLETAVDYVNPIQSSTDRLGYVIFQANDVKEAIRLCENAINTIKIITVTE